MAGNGLLSNGFGERIKRICGQPIRSIRSQNPLTEIRSYHLNTYLKVELWPK
jgi:hypothetical protein